MWGEGQTNIVASRNIPHPRSHPVYALESIKFWPKTYLMRESQTKRLKCYIGRVLRVSQSLAQK